MGKYSETLMEHFSAPRNGGVLEGADLVGRAGTPGRGASVILYLRVRDVRVAEAKYQTHGCGPTIAAGSALTELILGRTLAQCAAVTPEHLITALDGVPPDKLHCPALAVAALKSALRG